MLKEIKERVSSLFNFEKARDEDMYYMKKNHIVWLLSQVEKAEQLQRELEEYKLENQSLKGTIDIIERKHRELVKRLAESNEEIERYEKALKKIADINLFEDINRTTFLILTARKALEGEE